MKGLTYDFTDKEVSPGSNCGYDPVDLAEGIMVSTIVGTTRMAHAGTLRQDEVIQLKLDKMTIDLDFKVITRYVSLEGVEKGYNPKRHGRGSHHPLLAFVAEAQMVANDLKALRQTGLVAILGESFRERVYSITQCSTI